MCDNKTETPDGVSYYTTMSKKVIVNIPFWERNPDSKITHDKFPLFNFGETCEICNNTIVSNKRKKKNHECIFETGSYHPMRIYSKEFLMRLFNDMKMGVNCEKAIFNCSVQYCKNAMIVTNWKSSEFCRIYKHKFMGVRFNLLNKKNPRLLQRVLDGEIKSFKLPFMDKRELFPEHWIGKEFGKSIIIISQPEVSESIINCPSCKSNKVHYYQLQTRSADEPMTTFCTCTNCNKRWKFS